MQTYNQLYDRRCVLSGDGVVLQLEKRFKTLLKNQYHILALNNVSCSLSSVFRALPADAVAAPVFTAPQSYSAIHHAGKKVLFCDVEKDSACLSPASVKACLNGPASAILAVNIFGHESDLSKLKEIADHCGALLCLDAAQSTGTILNAPNYTGEFADVVIFSLAKFLGCLDGAVVAVKSLKLWQDLISQTQHINRQILDTIVPINLDHWNHRINPASAHQALRALNKLEAKITRVQNKQRQQINALKNVKDVELFPESDRIIFEPLTVLTERQIIPGWNLGALPIPLRVQLAKKHNLIETIRQFRFRKTLVKQK